MQNLIDTHSRLQKRSQYNNNFNDQPLLTLLAFTYANSILYSLVTKSKGRSQARKCNLAWTISTQLDDLLAMYDRGEGNKVDQPTLIQY